MYKQSFEDLSGRRRGTQHNWNQFNAILKLKTKDLKEELAWQYSYNVDIRERKIHSQDKYIKCTCGITPFYNSTLSTPNNKRVYFIPTDQND